MLSNAWRVIPAKAGVTRCAWGVTTLRIND
jgi:hypothetical protein